MADMTEKLTSLTSELTTLSESLWSGKAPNTAARVQMLAKSKELTSALLTPQEHAIQQGTNASEMFALRTIMQLGILDAIPECGSITLADLSARTKAQQPLIERLLRLLVGTRFIEQDDDGRYSHTRLSRGYLSLPGDFFVAIVHDLVMATLVRYPEYLDAHPDQKLSAPSSIAHNVYTWHKDSEGENYWAVMAKYPNTLARFQRGMQMLVSMSLVTGHYPFGELAADDDRPAIVDVGGGIGSCIVDILEAHPELKPAQIVLQDRPEILKLAEINTGLAPDVKKMAHDFFTDQPVKHARAYYMRYIIHDYSDEIAVDILRHLTVAMATDSKILIAESVLSERVDELSLMGATIDMFMFSLGGKERTEKMFRVVLDQAGLELKKVWRASNSAQAVIEATLK